MEIVTFGRFSRRGSIRRLSAALKHPRGIVGQVRGQGLDLTVQAIEGLTSRDTPGRCCLQRALCPTFSRNRTSRSISTIFGDLLVTTAPAFARHLFDRDPDRLRLMDTVQADSDWSLASHWSPDTVCGSCIAVDCGSSIIVVL